MEWVVAGGENYNHLSRNMKSETFQWSERPKAAIPQSIDSKEINKTFIFNEQRERIEFIWFFWFVRLKIYYNSKLVREDL